VIGASRLAGQFSFDLAPRVPVLAGRVTGARLVLDDLAPAVGDPVPDSVSLRSRNFRLLTLYPIQYRGKSREKVRVTVA
jgi:hypothetical protein